MKKRIILLMITGMSLMLTTSCLKEYLDKAPESGLTDEQVFSKYANFKLFFDAVYDGRKYYSGSYRDTWNIKSLHPLYFDNWDQKYPLISTTDWSDNGRYMEGHAWKSGNMSETIISKMCYDGARRPVLGAAFDDIRIVNIAIRKAKMVTDADKALMDDFMGQAYFIRAYCHFAIFRIWGPFPYVDYVMGPYDESWDLPRLPANDYLQRIAGDLDSAYYYFNLCDKVRRDPPPGVSGSLDYSQNQMWRPNGMAAKAFKSRALLYAASPLNNKNGITDWQAAAVASWEALQLALSKGVTLLPLVDPVSGNDRHLNFYGKDVCEESIWTYSYGSIAWNGAMSATWHCGLFMASTGSSSGCFPTQNSIDKYETLQGDPLNTDADRAAAAALNHFKEQDPFVNRDPRLLTDVIYNQSPCQGWGGSGAGKNKAQLYYNGTTPSELLNTSYLGRSYTGYMQRKYWANNSNNNKISSIFADPLFRLAELYLNYAEAANEAYGPNGSAPGATITALQALNIIRTRAGMPNVLPAYTGSTAALRPRIKNERTIEFAFEGQHYYHDIRRWKDLEGVMSSTLIANIPRVTTDLVNYPTGYIYSRVPLTADRQPIWEEGMYYLPFLNADALKMKNFVANPVW
jgi:hypothetical protein